MICTKCSKEEIRISTDRVNSKGQTVYTSSDGRVWKHTTCPTCRYGTAVRRRSSNTGRPAVVVSKRKCRLCSKALPATRYFNHEHCAKNEYYDIFSDYRCHALGNR